MYAAGQHGHSHGALQLGQDREKVHSPLSARNCRALGCCARERRPWIQPLRTVGTFQATQQRGPTSPKSPSSNSPCWKAKREAEPGAGCTGVQGRRRQVFCFP